MKAFLLIIFIFVAYTCGAQYYTVTNLSGTVAYSGTNVTVTSAGSASSITFCSTSPYWIGAGSGSTPDPGSYTFTFSPAISAMRLYITAANTGESFTVAINGSHYSLTSSELFTFGGSCREGPDALSGDTLLAPSTSGYGAFACGLNIFYSSINSVTFATNGLQNGTVFTLEISDTLATGVASNNGPVCPGDTMKLFGTSASSTATFAWSGPGGFTSTLQNPVIPNASYSDTGVYRLIVTTSGSDTAYTDFSLKPKPALSASSNSPACAGTSLSLTCGPDSTGETFSWSGPGGFSSALQNPVISAVPVADSGLYTVIATWNGCKDTATTHVSVTYVPLPTASNSSPVCEGNNVIFSATDSLSGVTYSWIGPGGYTSTAQNPSIVGATVSTAGAYVVSVSLDGCVQSAGTTVTINPVPVIVSLAKVPPTPCHHADGSIVLQGLTAGNTYTLNYDFNGTPIATSMTADGLGNINIVGLIAGLYNNITVSYNGCTSNIAGPVEFIDKSIPPLPTVSSNSPVCSGHVLALYATDSVDGLSYSWTGPGGFTSNLEYPVIPNIVGADSGFYTVTVSNGTCSNTSATFVRVVPSINLVNVTDSQTINLGASVQLAAYGAQYYAWTPNDGSLMNPNISNPRATPTEPTVYTVVGMNDFGCKDSANVFVNIIYPNHVFIPTAFTPNGDGLNDVFKITMSGFHRIVNFMVCDRWGKVVYQTGGNEAKGWDGTLNGVPQDIGVYTYMIVLAAPDGVNTIYKGDVTLVR